MAPSFGQTPGQHPPLLNPVLDDPLDAPPTRKETTMSTLLSRILLISAFLFILPLEPASAQTASPLRPGDSVRVQRLGPATSVEGTLRELTPTHLAVEPGGSGKTLLIPREQALQIDVRVTRRPWLKGAGVGALIGGGGMALIGLASGDDECSGLCFISFTAEEKAVMGFVAGGVLGGAMGLVVGALSRTRVWSPVPPEKVWVSPAVRPQGGVGVVIRIPAG
jgi:hypothetical protein